MDQTLGIDKKIILLSYAAAAATVIAGILHILMAPRSMSNEQGQGMLFLVGGILQVFWALPVIKGWNKIWYYVGIGGTAILVILWFATHIHGLTNGRGLRGMTIPLEVAQLVFIGLSMTLLKKRPIKQKSSVK